MMTTRTTVALQTVLYEEARSHYRSWGFAKLGDLLNDALGDYLEARRQLEWAQAMECAASDPRYQAALRQVSEDLAHVDAESTGPEY